MKYFLTYDVGTTSVKTCVFDALLRMCGYSNEEYALITETGGIVEVECSKKEGKITVVIRDHGEGMDQETQKRIFDPCLRRDPG